MGFYDRDYSRPPAGGVRFGTLPAWSVTTWLIALNVAAFLLDAVFRLGVANLGYFSADAAVLHLQVWRFVTFQFLHANPTHLFFNMLSLYFFGPMIENYFGQRRYLAFYLLCGASGAAAYLVLWKFGVLAFGSHTPLVGASAGIFGVLIAAARVAPDARVMLMFPPIPVRLKTLAWVMIAVAAFTVLSSGRSGRNNAGGEAAHLGGAALGAVLIRKPEWLGFADALGPRRRRPRGRFFGDD